MRNQFPSQVYYTQQADCQGQNQDLIRLRQMNQAFAKMNEQHLQNGYEYYTYQPQEMSQLQSFEKLKTREGIQQREHEEETERSNSLLFTLSEKDEEETRPATNVHNVHYECDRNGESVVNEQTSSSHNNQKFGSYEYDNSRLITVNNTLSNNTFNIQNVLHQNSYQQQFYYNNNSNDSQRYHSALNNQTNISQYTPINQTPQNSVISNGFSKYEQFAIKISKLFNIQVEDLEVIYNQLKFQKDTENHHQNSQPTGQFLQTVQISDSEVMKKLFSYALQIKNSHNQLKTMITNIDHRRGKYNSERQNQINYERKNQMNDERAYQQRPQEHIPHKNNEIQNISINFMLEEEINQNRSKTHQFTHQDDQTQRFQPSQTHARNDSQNIQSKKTIIQKLVSQKGYLNNQFISQQTLQSHSSYAQSFITNTKTSKSKKNSRVTEKIKLISEQLESLKKEIDLEEQSGDEEKQVFNQKIQTHQTLFPKHQTFHNTEREIQANIQKPSVEPISLSYLPKMTQQKSQYIIQVNKSQNPIPQKEKQSEVHTFGGQSFTYVKSIEELPMNDPEIDLKIQQTIKTCIVKSPSKKLIASQQYPQAQQVQKPQQNTTLTQSEKKSQKIIVEQGQISSSRSKYSFRQNSQVEIKNNDETIITSPTKSQSRQKMFKSIAELRKSNPSKDKNNIQRGKTTNNAYLDDEQTKAEEISYPKNVFKNNAPISQSGSSTSLAKPKFFSKQIMKDGKLIFEKVETTESETHSHIRQLSDQQKKTAYFGLTSPSQTEKLLPNNSGFFQQNVIPDSSQPINNTLIAESYQNSKKMLSLGAASSLYSAKTIQSRPFIQSENNLARPSIRLPIHLPNVQNVSQQVVQQPYSYTPNIPQMSLTPKNLPTSSPIFYQPFQLQSPQKTIVFSSRPDEIVRPVTPINKIQNINGNFTEKPRSFSVQRINPNRNLILQPSIPHNKTLPINSSQLKFLPSQNHQIIRPNIILTPTSQQKQVQRPFSVPMRSMTPQRNAPINFQQTLIEKPRHPNIQGRLKKEQPHNQLMAIKQFELKFKNQQKVPQATQIAPQVKQNVREQSPLYSSIKEKSLSNSRPIQLPIPGILNPKLNDSKHQSHQIQQNTPPHVINLPSSQQKRNPRLQESEMYYGQLQASTKQSNNQGNQNYQEMNLMSSRRGESSVVHAFPVHLQQSQRMNNSIYTKEQFTQNQTLNKNMLKPVYGQIITYQPPNSPKVLNSLSNQPTRIPTNFRPPKYIPAKQPHRFPLQNNKIKNLQQSSSQRLQQSSKPPIKTYTMGHLLEASRTSRYMQQSIADDKKSNTALNASNIAGRVNDLYDSTPSFGRINSDEANSQSLVVSPFSKQLNKLNQSRNSSVSRHSSSSRSRSNKKGITLESKRNKTPTHQFYQSSYHH